MRRREFIAGLGSAAAWPHVVQAQRPAIPVVGWLAAGTPDDAREWIAATRQGLAEMGFVEQRDFAWDVRGADYNPERLPEFAADLVRRRVAAIIAPTTASAAAAKAATGSIPIVFQAGADPVEHGFVASLNRPGGNLTGVSNLGQMLAAKRLEALHDLAPTAALFAVLVNPRSPVTPVETKELQAAADVMGLPLAFVDAAHPDEFEKAFAAFVRQRAGAVLVSTDALFVNRADALIALAARHSIPTMYWHRAAAKAGGLISFSADVLDGFRLVGIYVARILKGEKPADLPVQLATKVELIINLKTAKALGLTVPPSILLRADEVIE